jgi:ATP-dependent RNA helicase SUPV3L1/SUV3
MNEIGFTRAGDAWRWRGRRGAREDRRAPASHAFAELAKLKKK